LTFGQCALQHLPTPFILTTQPFPRAELTEKEWRYVAVVFNDGSGIELQPQL
jgi:hypothetical protein